MLRATLKSLLSRKLRLVLSGAGRGAGGDVRVGGVRAHRHAGPLVRPALHRRVRQHRRPGRRRSRSSAGEDFDDDDGSRQHPGRRRWTRSARCRASPSATGVAIADGARVIGANGKVVTIVRPAPVRRWTGSATPAAAAAARGPRDRPPTTRSRSTPRWPRRPASRWATTSACSPCSRKKIFTLVGIFGYPRRQGLPGRHPGRGVHRAGGAGADAGRDRTCTPMWTSRPRRGVSDDAAARPGRRRARRRLRRSRPASSSPTRRPGASARRSAFFNNILHRLRRCGAVRRHLPHPQHVLHHRRAAHPGTGADAGPRRPAGAR